MPMYQPASHARTAGGYGRVNGGPPRMRRDGVRVDARIPIPTHSRPEHFTPRVYISLRRLISTIGDVAA
jgi:hypothetical protein